MWNKLWHLQDTGNYKQMWYHEMCNRKSDWWRIVTSRIIHKTKIKHVNIRPKLSKKKCPRAGIHCYGSTILSMWIYVHTENAVPKP